MKIKVVDRFDVINEDLRNHIYMIRNDGKILDLKDRYTHPLLKPTWKLDYLKEFIYDTLSDVCFYYLNTSKEETKKNIYHLLTMLLFYKPTAILQVERNGVVIKEEEDIYTDEPFDLLGLYQEIAEECMQEFIKVRLGGMFNTTSKDTTECVFRIASTGFNWFDNICNFLMSHSKDIKSVTIVRDKELTNEEAVYEINREKIYQYPIEDFILLKGKPIVESEYSFLNELAKGKTILEAYGVPHIRHALREFYCYKKFDRFEM